MLSVHSPQEVPPPQPRSPTSSASAMKQPVTENAVPVQLRELLKQCYGLEEGADLFMLPNNPCRLFVVYRGQLRSVDLLAWQAIQQGNVPACSTATPNTSLNETGVDGHTAPPVTPVTPLQPVAVGGWSRTSGGGDWQKTISDKEREFLQRERRRSNAYKTSLCNAFRDTGQCSYGAQCRFAHGVVELRPAPEPHPKYKTQLCNKFALYGVCPYGIRCQFIHMRPCEMCDEDYRAPMNFSASLDGCGSRVFAYRCYSSVGKARYHGRNANETPYPARCDTFPPHSAGPSGLRREGAMVGMEYNRFSSKAFWLQHSATDSEPGQGTQGYHRGPNAVYLSSPGNFNTSDITTVDDLFSTLSVGENSSAFTQSCFPRINADGCIGSPAHTVSN